MKKYIVYYRHWLKKTPSFVEIAAQEAASRRFVSFNEGRVIATYTDQEDKRTKRPELAKAIEHAVRSEAALVVAHLGRLARNIPVTRALLDSHVDFVCLDAPDINTRTIHLFATMAEEETRKVSDRAKKAMAAATARGVKLGSARPGHWKGREHLRGTKKAIAAAARKKKERTRNNYAFLMPEIKSRRERGDTLPEIVDWLNQQGHVTTTGKPFTQTAVWRLIARYLGKELLGNNLRKMAQAR